MGTRHPFPHFSLLGQKPAITPVNSAENSTSTTRPTRSMWPYTPPSVSTFSAWGRGEPATGWGSGVLPGEGESKDQLVLGGPVSQYPGLTWSHLPAGAEKVPPLSQESLRPLPKVSEAWGPRGSGLRKGGHHLPESSGALSSPRVCCSVAKSCPTLCTPWTAARRLPCPSLSPGVCSHSCPLSQWCHLLSTCTS